MNERRQIGRLRASFALTLQTMRRSALAGALVAAGGVAAQGLPAKATWRVACCAEHEAVLQHAVERSLRCLARRRWVRQGRGPGDLRLRTPGANSGAQALRETRNASMQAELLRMGATGKAEAEIAVLRQKEGAAQMIDPATHDRLQGGGAVPRTRGRDPGARQWSRPGPASG
jgi:hypothetical protein